MRVYSLLIRGTAMKYEIHLTDEDYLEFNKFHAIRSPYGKKTVRNCRILIACIFALAIVATLLSGGFTLDSVFRSIPYAVLLLLFEIFLKAFLIATVKSTVKQLKKKGKMAYTPHSTLEFKESSFIESCDEHVTEQSYASVERISVIKEKYVYLHTNNLAGFIVPSSAFSCKAEYEAFIAFLPTICPTIDHYDE